jgi:hypothetical protein
MAMTRFCYVSTLSRLDFLLKASKIESKIGIDASNNELANFDEYD